jgi:hypothetical protein
MDVPPEVRTFISGIPLLKFAAADYFTGAGFQPSENGLEKSLDNPYSRKLFRDVCLKFGYWETPCEV